MEAAKDVDGGVGPYSDGSRNCASSKGLGRQ